MAGTARAENRWRWLTAAAVAAAGLVVALLFWLNWKIQFAAPAGFLFASSSASVEAGYCLAVAQEAGRDPLSAEIADFWVARLAASRTDMGRAIAKGRVALGRDLAATSGDRREWVREAMLNCADRAVTYGARLARFR
jgi:hypothetical protein